MSEEQEANWEGRPDCRRGLKKLLKAQLSMRIPVVKAMRL